jgi:hypothetical protein
MGITAYEDTFTYKNICKNILTGINKEDICVAFLTELEGVGYSDS